MARILLLLVAAAALIACPEGSDPVNFISPTARLLTDESAPRDERLDAMQDLSVPVPEDVVEALLMVMKDRSQQAFVMARDDTDLGYHVEESPYGGPDDRADLRWEAVIALERLGVRAAIPDLWSAIHDRHPVVRNHAARALWRFGYPKALDVLVKALEGRALENETANRMLIAITGQDLGFDTDGGHEVKATAIARWKAWFDEHGYPRAKQAPRKGEDPILDRRVRFLVDVLGQHQFLFMEQSRRNLSAMGELAVDHLRPALATTANQTLRAYAVQVLRNIGTDSARELLRGLLTDREASVRQRAADALGELGDGDAREALVAALADPDEGVVLAATRSLGLVGDATSEPALRRVFADDTAARRLRLTAACALVRLGVRDDAAGYLLGRLGEGQISERVEVVDFLRAWHGRELGYDPNRPGTEQAEALAKWADALR